MRKYFFGWNNIKKILIEIYRTLSNEDSELSSKRLITFAANNSVICLTWMFVLTMLYTGRLTATEFVISITPIVGIGAYSLTKSELAKKETPNE